MTGRGYFSINTLADSGASDYCFTDRVPAGIATRWHRLATGVAFATEWPDDVTLTLGEDFPGLRLPSFLGNTSNMLPVAAAAAAVIFAHAVGRTERLPFVLLDHEGHVLSDDYVFVNPLERIPCLVQEQSELRRSKKGAIKDVIKPVLDGAKLQGAPEVFRLAEEPNVCLFSAAMVAGLERAGCSNFLFREVTVA